MVITPPRSDTCHPTRFALVPLVFADELTLMSDSARQASVRLLPWGGLPGDIEDVTQTTEVPIPDGPMLEGGYDNEVTEVKDEEPDTGALLDKVIDRRAWPAGAKVGDGTPGPGRKKFDIDERIVFAMAKVGGTLSEIAAHFGCSETVIGKRFGELIRQAKASRRIRLRQKQYQVALEGNPTMLIWLGKQELGQVDESRIRLGDLSRFSDEELVQIAAGKVPGQLTAGKKEDE